MTVNVDTMRIALDFQITKKSIVSSWCWLYPVPNWISTESNTNPKMANTEAMNKQPFGKLSNVIARAPMRCYIEDTLLVSESAAMMQGEKDAD